MPFNQVRCIKPVDVSRAELTRTRVSHLLPRGRNFLNRYDLPSGASTWKEESSHLHLDLLYRRLGFRHVRQSVWHSIEAHPRRS